MQNRNFLLKQRVDICREGRFRLSWAATWEDGEGAIKALVCRFQHTHSHRVLGLFQKLGKRETFIPCLAE